MIIFRIVVALVVSSAARAHAQEGVPCPPFQSAQDVLACAMKNHPVLKRAAAAQAQAAYLEPIALQRPNPELDALGKFGRHDGDRLNKDEATLFHTIETGGKRSARAAKARADQAVVSADALKAREEVALDTVSALYRVRQALSEAAILDRTISSLVAFEKQLSARPRLTPEQEATREVFRLAESESNLRKASLAGEADALVQTLSLAVAGPFEANSSFLPPAKTSWPDLLDASAIRAASSELVRARAGTEAAAADLSAARGAAYPDVRVGPTMERETEGSIVKQTYGLAVGLPLPLYHRNRAGKEYARLGVRAAEANSAAVSAGLTAERQAELRRYRAAVNALRRLEAGEEPDKKAARAEELFRRGLIPSSLLLESYRQVFELTKTRDEAELTAIRSLWRVYAIEGRVSTEKL